jgi:hypothetical protein
MPRKVWWPVYSVSLLVKMHNSWSIWLPLLVALDAAQG